MGQVQPLALSIELSLVLGRHEEFVNEILMIRRNLRSQSDRVGESDPQKDTT